MSGVWSGKRNCPIAAQSTILAVGVTSEDLNKKKTTTTRQSKKLEEVKTAGGNPASISSTRGSTEQLDDRYLKLEGQVSQLKATVDSQNALIAKITSQLNFVLSFLDIENHNDGPNNTKLNQAESSSSSIGANPTLNEAALYKVYSEFCGNCTAICTLVLARVDQT